MSGKKGYQATLKLSQRNSTQRGGNAPNDLPTGDPGSLARHAGGYLEHLAVRNYTPDTIEGRRDALKVQNSVFDLKRGNVWSKLDSLKREPG